MIRQLLSPSHSYFSFGIICGRLWGSLAVEDHLRSILGIICGLGISCGWGSFAVLYSTSNYLIAQLQLILLMIIYKFSVQCSKQCYFFLSVARLYPYGVQFNDARLSNSRSLERLCLRINIDGQGIPFVLREHRRVYVSTAIFLVVRVLISIVSHVK